ncbi:MAG: YdeI/OmpD-associated family protein [Algoriphagus sp.]|nr:YdeI/OmpD-associated family protein [Algoriphagus sp.]
MTPIFFTSQDEFRAWLVENHLSESELFVGFYKVSSGKPSMTWSESVDQALCFGWIDGVKYSINKDSYKIRFTPRKKTSIWSAVNIKKVENLIENGLMQSAGLESFNNRSESKSKIYAFENAEVMFSPELEKLFKANKVAWDYFQSLAPTYRKPSSNWVMSAKQEATRLKRLLELIADSESGTNKWKENKYKKK